MTLYAKLLLRITDLENKKEKIQQLINTIKLNPSNTTKYLEELEKLIIKL